MESMLPRRSYIWQFVSSLILGVALCATAHATSWYMKPWKEVYARIHPNTKPSWKSLNDAREWARKEQDLIEPVLLRILNSEYEDISWTHGLPVAREVPTGPVKNVLHRRLNETVRDAPDGCITLGSKASGGVTTIIEILGRSRDVRVESIALALVSKDCQPSLVVERCVEALQRVGGRESIEQLRRIPLRQRSEHIDRLCALAEKAIHTREQGRDIFANAEEELRVVTAQFIRATEQRDFTSFTAIQPFGFRRAVDEEEFTREILPHPESGSMLRVLKEIAGREQFRIDRDNYRATLIVDGRYQFTYVLEVDGWKILGPIRVGR